MVIFPSYPVMAALLVALPVAGGATARPAQSQPGSAPLLLPRSIIADDGEGFVIRSANPSTGKIERPQATFIPLGASLHIDRQIRADRRPSLEEAGHAPR